MLHFKILYDIIITGGIDMKKKIIKQIPNIITITRIISLIIGFILFCKEKFLYAIILYIYGAVSDFLDGYLARRLNAYTKLGKYLDAISDKLYSFSVMILLIIYRSILIIIPLLLEGIISFVNYKIIIKYKSTHTERVGKHKMNLEFLMLISSMISIKIKYFSVVFYIFLILTIYFQIQTIISYINQFHNKSKEKIIDLKGKNIIEKIKFLFNEFIFYLIHPVKIIK